MLADHLNDFPTRKAIAVLALVFGLAVLFVIVQSCPVRRMLRRQPGGDNSPGWRHSFQPWKINPTGNGGVERCERCGRTSRWRSP